MNKEKLIATLNKISSDNGVEIAVAFEVGETARNIMSVENWWNENENIIVLRAKGNLADQMQILKNALWLAERENERLKEEYDKLLIIAGQLAFNPHSSPNWRG